MNVQEIEGILLEGISSIIKRDKSSLGVDKAFHELGVDSLGFVEILVFIEKKFKLQLIASDLTKKDFESIRSLAAYLSRKLQ